MSTLRQIVVPALTPRGRLKTRPMPKQYVQKYFGREKLPNDSQQTVVRARKFLAEQFEVDTKDILILNNGEIRLSPRAFSKMKEAPLDDNSFLERGGTGRPLYEMGEMICNDLMSGSVGASGHSVVGVARELVGKAVEFGGEKVKSVVEALSRSGVAEMAAGAGAGATAGIGIWLVRGAAKQLFQGLGRGDKGQVCDGARGLFLGLESLTASAALASRLGSGAVMKGIGGVAEKAAFPLAIIHSAVDFVQGSAKIREGLQQKDALDLVEGVADIGMGAGWLSIAYSPTPEAVVVSCICLATKTGVAVVRNRKRNQEIEQFQRQAMATAQEALNPNKEYDHQTMRVLEPNDRVWRLNDETFATKDIGKQPVVLGLVEA